ncbi:phosphoribosylglycinamide formyltransferase [Blastopirellula sp. JC732]|uniref:Phosphoribosylglycinamide formyltransferase n=1 Tax=Blastopirellula sediminis TaxID=2894196 RepID=A0A9X1MKW7_9BACT|nr:phosphoribosylglycinamide formyltransferase [Blastopirellula sediminis]MCC9609128.1 phosphoribosylglycinamide formyltransferase [Blastopirellula sediminis]MCC9628095.1 phosphoribosylglycinamide formyltransferase [Blastopirellula sediminis]
MSHCADNPLRVAVLISGGGTTLRNLLEKIAAEHLWIKVALVVSSTPKAKGLQYATDGDIPVSIADWKSYESTESFSEAVFGACRAAGVDLVVMGGFLKHVLIPADFDNRVINIHPSLIPAFCGEGFYGARVHQAAIDYGVKLSGCTIHLVDNHYDNGPVVAQQSVPVLPDDDAAALAARVFEAECELYPHVLQLFAEGRITIDGRKVAVR